MKKRIILTIVLFSLAIFVAFPFVIFSRNFSESATSSILAYAGAVFGGFLTLVGVYIALFHREHEREEELELLYLPVLSISSANFIDFDKFGELDSHETPIRIDFKIDNPYFDTSFFGHATRYHHFSTKLCNVGRGEIRDLSISIKSLMVSIFESDSLVLNKENIDYSLYDNFLRFVPVSGYIYLILSIPHLAEEKLNDIKRKDSYLFLSFSGKVILKFVSVFNKKVYKYEMDFSGDINFNPNGECSYELEDINLFLNE